MTLVTEEWQTGQEQERARSPCSGTRVIADASAARWSQPSLRPCLESDDVHVWCAHIPSVVPLEARLEDVLSDEERIRLRTIRFERDRRQFVVGRAALRNILSRYLEVDATQIAFEYERHGKPVLSALCNPIGFHFNVSHSVDWVVCAVARGRAVGVDIEYRRSGVNYVAIAERVLSAAERHVFQRVPPRARDEVFFNVWTRKEAYVKAIGQGVFYPFSEIDVTLRAEESPRLLRAFSEPYPARWSLRALNVAKHYTGALAVAGPVRELALWEWTHSEPAALQCDVRTRQPCTMHRHVPQNRRPHVTHNTTGDLWYGQCRARTQHQHSVRLADSLDVKLAGTQRIDDERLVGKPLRYRR